uniref:Uncharacterized protein LOC113790668 n=1 Tax=Dermatophagoides pteronyssinus TaxID=6956 RepID=A0A6P6XRR2_DERPT|nr:uncharacterized protein LOC113790668 [Dermatophagoides pteronyssinus]
MTLPSERTGIITIDEFAHACSMGQILPILIKNSAVITTLSQSNIQSFQIIYQQSRLIPDRETALKCLRSLYYRMENKLETNQNQNQNNNNFGFILPAQYLHIVSILLNDHHHHHHHKDNRLLHIAPDTIGSSFYSIITAIPVRKSFPFRKTFGKFVSILVSSGIITNWKNIEYSQIRKSFNRYVHSSIINDDNPHHDHHHHHNNKIMMMIDLTFQIVSISVSRHLYSIFYFYLLMISLSFIIFIVEILQFIAINNRLFR